MAQTLTQISGTNQTVMTSELNSLANNASVVSSVAGASGVITLTSTGYLQALCELLVTFGTNPTANSTINVWFLTASDGTNFEDGSSSVIPQRNPDVFFPMRAVTTAQRIAKLCKLPVGTFKVLVQNNGTGQAMASSGNTVKILPITNQIG